MHKPLYDQAMGIRNIGFRLVLLACGALFAFTACSSNSLEPSKDEKLTTLYLNAGNEEMQNGNTTLALKNLQLAAKHSPKNEEVLLSLGIAYFRKGDSKQAEDIFRKILQLNPSNNFARNSLAALYIESKRFVEAEKALEVALKDLSFPDQHKALFNLAIIQEKRGQILRAEKTLQKSLKENPNFCPGWMKLSEIQLRQSKRAEAIDSLQSGSVGLCYSFTQNHYQLGLLHMQMNDNQSAREKFDEIARRFPKTHWAKLANEKLNIIQGRN